MIHFFDLTPTTLQQLGAELRMPRYAAAQVLSWVYERRTPDFEAMSDLSKLHRQALTERIVFFRGVERVRQCASDGTQKLLLAWRPLNDATNLTLPVVGSGGGGEGSNKETECVMIPAEDRRTACISSQVGCPVGCAFCASGLGGVEGNLTAGQIVEQVYRLGMLPDVRRITNVVFMGMGEPLANYAAVMRAVRTLMAPWGLHIGARRITISTVGLPRAIERLADEDLPVTLAISLHAPNDALRRELIPWAEYTTIADLMDAGRYYFQQTGREVTLEYILLGGVNDHAEHADQLASVAKTLRANVNLIRYNEVAGLPYARPGDAAVRRFQEVLRQRGVNAHIRASRGRDIAAACGQLRHEHRAARAV